MVLDDFGCKYEMDITKGFMTMHDLIWSWIKYVIWIELDGILEVGCTSSLKKGIMWVLPKLVDYGKS